MTGLTKRNSGELHSEKSGEQSNSKGNIFGGEMRWDAKTLLKEKQGINPKSGGKKEKSEQGSYHKRGEQEEISDTKGLRINWNNAKHTWERKKNNQRSTGRLGDASCFARCPLSGKEELDVYRPSTAKTRKKTDKK